MDEHARTRGRQDCSEHIHRCQNRRVDGSSGHEFIVSLESQFCRIKLGMVHSWRNRWNPQAAQPRFAITGTLALALLFGRSMVGPLFAQTAWTNVTFIGSEARDPGKNLVRALSAGARSYFIFW